jgi:hypothetical protein
MDCWLVEKAGKVDIISKQKGLRTINAEGVYLARFDLDALRDYRCRVGWGNAFRRPRRYQALIDETVREPFIRESATR